MLTVALLCLGGCWSLSDILLYKRVPSTMETILQKNSYIFKGVSCLLFHFICAPQVDQDSSEVHGLFTNTAKYLSSHVFWLLKAPSIYNAPFPNSGQPKKLRSEAQTMRPHEIPNPETANPETANPETANPDVKPARWKAEGSTRTLYCLTLTEGEFWEALKSSLALQSNISTVGVISCL